MIANLKFYKYLLTFCFVLLFAAFFLQHSNTFKRDSILTASNLAKSTLINSKNDTISTLSTSSIILTSILKSIEPTNLLCVILTSKKTIFERAPAGFETWSHRCNKTLFSLNSNNLTENIAETNLEFLNKIEILHLPINDSYDKMAEKMILTLKLIYEINTPRFNWYMIVDDDTFVYIDNLHKFIQATNPNLAFSYGFNFKTVVPTGYHSGGGGVLMPNESLKRFYESIINNKCPFIDGYSDVALGECSRISNVKLGNSTDSMGRERFHALDAKSHYEGILPDWLYSYASNKVKSGIECCSSETISFHYVTPQEMYIMAKSQNYLDFINNTKI